MSRPFLGEPRHLLAPGALGADGHQLTIHERRVCLYEYSDDAVRYFSPSLSGASVPAGSGAQAWAEFVHRDDRGWLLDLHANAVAAGVGYEALFRFDRADGTPLWVVDRQERSDMDSTVTWHGMSLEVTDLVEPPAVKPVTAVPVPLEVYCLPEPDTGVAASAERSGAVGRALPLPATAARAWVNALRRSDRSSGTIVADSVRDGMERSVMVAWAPLRDEPAHRLLAVAVADVTDHLARDKAQHDRLRDLVRAARGTAFSLAPGGRARLRREWLREIDPAISAYSDLLRRAPAAQVRRLRSARRRALESLESYLAALTCSVGGRTRRFVELGLPDAASGEWNCALVPLSDAGGDEQRDALKQLAQESRLDPRAQLFRGLLHEATAERLLTLLVEVGGHEAHVRRRLSMLSDVEDRADLGRLFSHPLARPQSAAP